MEKERKASKENRGALIIASIVLIVLLFTGAGGYTYARYATKEQGKGNAQIAKWAFEIEKGQEEMKKVKLVNTAQKDTLVNGKIAPGTSGSFSITLSAKNSEVGVKYTLSFLNEKNKPTNIKFKYKEKEDCRNEKNIINNMLNFGIFSIIFSTVQCIYMV